MVIPDFVPFARAAAEAPPSGIAIVEQAINQAIKDIEAQLGVVKPRNFEQDGAIATRSFGSSPTASAVALHHARAHAVMRDTLIGVRADLKKFQQACTDARAGIKSADDRAAEDLELRRRIALGLSDGVGNQGNDAYDRAVTDHADTTPETPPTTPEDGTSGEAPGTGSDGTTGEGGI